MTEAKWLEQLNLYMDHNDNWTRADMAKFIFLTQARWRAAMLEQLNEGHSDGPWKETHESNQTSPSEVAR